MPQTPTISSRECVLILQRLGFIVARQKGSHIILDNEKGRTVVVPSCKELPKGTLRSILKQAGITLEEFLSEA